MRRKATLLTGVFVAGFSCFAASQDFGAFNLENGDSLDEVAYTFEHRAMGTEFKIILYPREEDLGYDTLAPVAEEAFQEVDSLEYRISSWIPATDTSRVNREAHRGPVSVVAEAFKQISVSAELFRDTGGVFDVTVGPLIELWRVPLEQGTRPDAAELEKALALVGMDKVELEPEKRSIRFAKEGMRVSFGGIGKGLALDRMIPVLRRNGITSALISGGDSSMYALGAPPGQDFWKIGIHNPYNPEDSVAIVHLRDEALSTSACYQHLEGVTGRPCGIFNPRTGIPVEGMVSATVIAPSGMLTDALSTAFYVMGTDGVRDYCERHPEVSATLVPDPVAGLLRPVYIGIDSKQIEQQRKSSNGH